MSETKAPVDAPIEEILKNETESETKVEVKGPEDSDKIVDKAEAKLAMINVPTERKQQEDLGKMVGQVHAAEVHKSLEPTPGTVNPENQTFGVLGMPLAAAVHDFDLDREAAAQASVKTKRAEDDKKIKEHNESLARIVTAIEKSEDSK